MNQYVNINETERKVFLSLHEDGLIDLFLSFIMVVSILSSILSFACVGDALRISIYMPLMVILGSVLYMLGKKHITFPRVGYAKLAGKRTKPRLVIFAIITAVLLALVLMTLINGNEDVNNSVMSANAEIWPSLFMTLIIIGVFSLIAALMGINRFYLLGLIMGLSEPLTVIFDRFTKTENVGLYAYGIPAILLLISGACTLNRFIREYPLNEVEVDDNNE